MPPTTPPAPRRTGTRAAETAARRTRLLAAATALAVEGGYEAVQMRDVAARAEVALGTLYRHFASKDQLLVAALADQARRLEERLARRPPAGTTPAVRVAGVLADASRALERRPRMTAAMVTALNAADAQAAPTKHEVYDRFRAMIATAIGDEPVDHLDDVVRVLGYVWFAVLTTWVGGVGDGAAMGDELRRAAHLLLDGAGAPARRG